MQTQCPIQRHSKPNRAIYIPYVLTVTGSTETGCRTQHYYYYIHITTYVIRKDVDHTNCVFLYVLWKLFWITHIDVRIQWTIWWGCIFPLQWHTVWKFTRPTSPLPMTFWWIIARDLTSPHFHTRCRLAADRAKRKVNKLNKTHLTSNALQIKTHLCCAHISTHKTRDAP